MTTATTTTGAVADVARMTTATARAGAVAVARMTTVIAPAAAVAAGAAEPVGLRSYPSARSSSA
jgi:hypothetical protein